LTTQDDANDLATLLERHKPLLRYDSQGSFYADRIHGHVAIDDKHRLWLQYWFFYYYNDKAFLGVGLHEGDWEMVQIGLDVEGKPEAMTFAQHAHGERCSWGQVEKQAGQRPVVYVARGSQASYPRAGRHRAPIVSDNADGKGQTVSPTLELLDQRQSRWVGWPGRWGSTRARSILESDSPEGPKHRPARVTRLRGPPRSDRGAPRARRAALFVPFEPNFTRHASSICQAEVPERLDRQRSLNGTGRIRRLRPTTATVRLYEACRADAWAWSRRSAFPTGNTTKSGCRTQVGT
jgi:hypothetical protein